MRIALILLLLSFASQANAQSEPTSFEELVNGAREVASRLDGEQRDAFWQDFAGEAFLFYRANPASDGGRKALDMAFRIWGSDGTLEDITGALAYIDPASDVWDTRLLDRVALAYGRAGRPQEYSALLHDLKGTLTHPRAVSAVLLKLSHDLSMAGHDEEARPHLEQIVALDADSALVVNAEGFLYQLDYLAMGMEAPDFSTPTLAGDTLRLSDFRGQVVLLDFWATWCSPCLPEIPYLLDTFSTYRDQGFVIIGVSHDLEHEALVSMVEEKEMAWPHIWEARREEGELARRYNVRWLPRSFLIDREGRIVDKDLRGDALAEAVAKLL